MLVENDPHEVHAHLADFSRRLGGRDRVQQPFRRIERPNGVVAGKLNLIANLFLGYRGTGSRTTAPRLAPGSPLPLTAAAARAIRL